jgi:hypothetical protein
MPYLLPRLGILRFQFSRVDGLAERLERGEPVRDARFGKRGGQARLVSLDRKSQDVVFWRCDAGFAQEEVVG